ncbi:hypothetical protein GCM10020254_20540 [Streptomyces goshikiensis]
MYASYNTRVTATDFTAMTGLVWLAVVVAAGVRRPQYAVVAGLVFAVAPRLMADYVTASAHLPVILFGLAGLALANDPDGYCAALPVRAAKRRAGAASTGAGPTGAVSTGAGPAGAGSTGTGPAGAGSTGAGSAVAGSAEAGPARSDTSGAGWTPAGSGGGWLGGGGGFSRRGSCRFAGAGPGPSGSGVPALELRGCGPGTTGGSYCAAWT